MNAILQSIDDVLMQGISLLDELNDESYAAIASAPFHASIGQHYRHILDHFVSLAEGLSSGRIDYDHRARERQWEINVGAARQVTVTLLDLFHAFEEKKMLRSCRVLQTVGYQSGTENMHSIFAREIAYCVSHAVHHFAIIRFVAASFGINVAPELGIAPSTMRHRIAVAAAS